MFAELTKVCLTTKFQTFWFSSVLVEIALIAFRLNIKNVVYFSVANRSYAPSSAYIYILDRAFLESHPRHDCIQNISAKMPIEISIKQLRMFLHFPLFELLFFATLILIHAIHTSIPAIEATASTLCTSSHLNNFLFLRISCKSVIKSNAFSVSAKEILRAV